MSDTVDVQDIICVLLQLLLRDGCHPQNIFFTSEGHKLNFVVEIKIVDCCQIWSAISYRHANLQWNRLRYSVLHGICGINPTLLLALFRLLL